MKVVINEDEGTLYVKFREAEPERDFRSTYWSKFGVFPHWDGRGGLIGIEFVEVAGHVEVSKEGYARE